MQIIMASILDSPLDYVILTLLIAFVSSVVLLQLRTSLKFPVINVKNGEWTWTNARKRFLNNAAALLLEGQKQVS